MKTIPASLNMCQNLIYLCSLLNTALNSIIPQGGSPRSTLFVVVMLLVTNVKHSSQSLSPPPPPQPPSQPTSISNHPVFTNTVSSSSSKTVSNPHSRFVSITSSAVSKSTASSVSPNPPGATALNKYAASGVFSNLISSVVSNSSTRNMAAITTTTKPPPTTPTTTTASTAVTTAMTGTTAATTAATTTAATTAAAAIAAAAVPPSVHPHQSSANSSSSTNNSRWCTVGILAPEDPPLHGLGNNATFHATLQAGLTAARDLLQDTCTVLEHVRYVDCTLRSSLLAVFNLSLNPRHVLIGPPCSAAANIISVIGRPVITWIPLCPRLDFPGQSQDVGQGQEGSGTMAVSSYGRYQSLAQSVLLTLEHFHWTKIASVVSQDEFCSQLYQVMEPLLDSSLTRHLRFDPLNVSSIEQALTTVRHRYRILVTCSSLDAFGDLLSSAERLGMTSESYVIVHVTLGSWREVGEIFKSDYSHTSLSRSVLFVGHFTDRLQRRAATNTGINKAASSAQKNGQFLDYFYDAVLLWAAAQKRAGVGHTPDFVNLTLTGHTGRVEMDGEGVRTRVSRVLHYQDGRLVPVADLSHGRFTVLAPLTWPGGSLPSDTFPSPGGVDSDTVIGAVLGTVFVLLVLLLSLFLIRRWRQDRLSQGRAWQVEDREVKRRHQTHVTSQNGNTYRRRLMRMETRGTLGLGSICSLDRNQLFAPVGNYRGTVVAVKTIQCRSFRLTPDIVTDLNILKDLSHDNLNTFVGAHVEPGNTYVLFKYCAKGSLQDVLENEDITLDWMFKMSFATDLARGMEYLHKSALKSHGNLKSSNCVIDSRWVLKITDFGAVTSPIDDHDDMSHHAVCNALLWTAPELVRLALRSRKGSQKGDVFSFAIVLQEILFRVGPYGHDCSSPEEIIENVKRCGTIPFRPHIPQDPDVPEKALTLMTSCWDESPEQRPEFNVIRKRLLELNGGKKVSVVDNMLSLMETYSSRLEQLVADRTAELAQEKAKTDRLLYQMLPASVAEQLKCGRAVVPEFYDSVSIFFSDIVGFTTIASQSKPLEIVELLNDLYTAFDDVICRRDVYKVETIGDAYMCASGCPRRNGKRHAGEIADMALNLVATVSTVQVRHLPSESLQLRVGLHTGPCAAGVVGVAMPRYCLFGDTVNMASRMESTGKALHIHISSDMRAALEELDCGFLTLERGMIQVKGKGVYRTFWLVGREGYNKTLPDTFSKLRQTLGEANSRPPSPSNTSLTVGDGMYSALRKTSLAVSHFTVMSDSDDASTFVPGSPVRSESGVGLNADDYNENDDVFTQNADADGKHVSIGEGADPKLGAIPRIEIS